MEPLPVIEHNGQTYTLQPSKFNGAAVETIRQAYYGELCHETKMAVEAGLPYENPSLKAARILSEDLQQIFTMYPAVQAASLALVCPDISTKAEAEELCTQYEDSVALGALLYEATGADEAGKSSLGEEIVQRTAKRRIERLMKSGELDLIKEQYTMLRNFLAKTEPAFLEEQES